MKFGSHGAVSGIPARARSGSARRSATSWVMRPLLLLEHHDQHLRVDVAGLRDAIDDASGRFVRGARVSAAVLVCRAGDRGHPEVLQADDRLVVLVTTTQAARDLAVEEGLDLRLGHRALVREHGVADEVARSEAGEAAFRDPRFDGGGDGVRGCRHGRRDRRLSSGGRGTTVPRTRAETARKQVRSGAVLRVFRERGHVETCDQCDGSCRMMPLLRLFGHSSRRVVSMCRWLPALRGRRADPRAVRPNSPRRKPWTDPPPGRATGPRRRPWPPPWRPRSPSAATSIPPSAITSRCEPLSTATTGTPEGHRLDRAPWPPGGTARRGEQRCPGQHGRTVCGIQRASNVRAPLGEPCSRSELGVTGFRTIGSAQHDGIDSRRCSAAETVVQIRRRSRQHHVLRGNVSAARRSRRLRAPRIHGAERPRPRGRDPRGVRVPTAARRRHATARPRRRHASPRAAASRAARRRGSSTTAPVRPGAQIPQRDRGLVVVMYSVVSHERCHQRRRVDHPSADPRSDPELPGGGPTHGARARGSVPLRHRRPKSPRPQGGWRPPCTRGCRGDQADREIERGGSLVGVDDMHELIQNHTQPSTHAIRLSSPRSSRGAHHPCRANVSVPTVFAHRRTSGSCLNAR